MNTDPFGRGGSNTPPPPYPQRVELPTIRTDSASTAEPAADRQLGLDEIRKSLEQLSIKTNTLQRKSSDLEKKLDVETEKFKSADDNFKTERIRTIETLGIFFALFTFISVNITIFSKVEYLSAAVFFMIMMALVLVLVLLCVNIFINQKPARSWFAPLIMLVAILGTLLWSTQVDRINLRINDIDSVNSGALGS